MRDRKSRPQGSTTRTLLLNGRHYHLISTITLYSTPILNLHPGSSNNSNIMINWFDLFAHFILFGFIHSTFRMLGNLTFYGKWDIQALFNSEWIFESIPFHLCNKFLRMKKKSFCKSTRDFINIFLKYCTKIIRISQVWCFSKLFANDENFKKKKKLSKVNDITKLWKFQLQFLP